MILTHSVRRNNRAGLTPQIVPARGMPSCGQKRLALLYYILCALLGGCIVASRTVDPLTALARGARSEENSLPSLPPPAATFGSRRRPSNGTEVGADGEGDGASYSRYSSDLQQGASIADQQRKCRERAARDGRRIAPDLEFADHAVSGTKSDRDGLNALMAAARRRRFKILYFENLSRLARESVISMPALKELVHLCGVRVISVTEGIDSAQDSWEILATILSLHHEQYVKYLSHAVFRGQEGNVLAGFSVGDWCFGYTSMPIPGSEVARRGRHAKPRMQYAINSVESAWVVRIFAWFVTEKRSIRWITQQLTRQNAPKDHRATTPGWHHDYVRRVLRNRKYIGVWPWGENANRRNPLTGDVRQEPRTAEECEKWVRHFPHLQIIDDETYAAAQVSLEANEAKVRGRRGRDGRLAGAIVGASAAHPRHLLSGLVRCGACGGCFHVSGTGGKYLTCVNYLKGSCTSKTQLARGRAERMLLLAIGERVLANPAWLKAVRDELEASHRRQQAEGPAAIAETKQSIVVVDEKIRRVVDRIENGQGGPELEERLAQRRAEMQVLIQRLERAERVAEAMLPPPTEAWVGERLRSLHTLLEGGGPAAAHALRQLVGGAIVVTEVRQPGRRRHFLRGQFAIRASALAAGIRGAEPASAAPTPPELSEEVILDFREPNPAEEMADRVKALFDAGASYEEMADQLGCHRNTVMKALAYWHEQRGLPAPDGRSLRKRLAKPTLPEQLADAAKELWDQDLLMHEIAERLHCNRDSLTKAIEHWFRSRGLEPPDGRARRKELPRKCSRDENAERPEEGTVGGDPS